MKKKASATWMMKAASTGDMFQKMIGEVIKGMSDVFGTADVTLIIGYDDFDADLDRTVFGVL